MFRFLLCMAAWSVPSEVQLTSDEHSALFHEFWFEKIAFYDNGAIIAIDGDPKTGNGLTLYRWDETGWHRLFQTTPREGAMDAVHLYVQPDGSKVYIADYQNLVHQWSASSGFKRIAAGTRADPTIMLHGQLYQGHKIPENGFFPPGDLTVSDKRIAAINKKLPQFSHPIEGRVYLNQMVFQDWGTKLAVGYRLGDVVSVFDIHSGKLLEKIPTSLPFPGYITVDPKFDIPKGALRTQLPGWYAGFHHLAKLAWHRGGLYGLFRKGFGDMGRWADLDQKGKLYDNSQHARKLLALGPHQVIWGDQTEKEDGSIVWQLYKSSTFSSPLN